MNRKNLISAGVLLFLSALTVSAIFRGNDMGAVFQAMGSQKPLYLAAAIVTAVFFVSMEGIVFCYLFRSLDYKTSLPTYKVCVRGLFLFRDHAFCHRRAAHAALLYAKRGA